MGRCSGIAAPRQQVHAQIEILRSRGRGGFQCSWGVFGNAIAGEAAACRRQSEQPSEKLSANYTFANHPLAALFVNCESLWSRMSNTYPSPDSSPAQVSRAELLVKLRYIGTTACVDSETSCGSVELVLPLPVPRAIWSELPQVRSCGCGTLFADVLAALSRGCNGYRREKLCNTGVHVCAPGDDR